MPKKSITLIDLNIFFLASTTESRGKIFKLVLDRMSKFGWMKQLVTILLFEIDYSVFVILNL